VSAQQPLWFVDLPHGDAMDAKARPNHRRYVEVLRSMSAAQRLDKAFELTELARRLFRLGLKKRFPNRSESELTRLYLQRLAECHNRDD
jgi:hypothetical protein